MTAIRVNHALLSRHSMEKGKKADLAVCTWGWYGERGTLEGMWPLLSFVACGNQHNW